ncbi:MAG: phosphate ABC transporter substrate-binding protein PstS [Chitinivibrionales bacterium]|nr:phosphate ABC transporter substrate-binding protein PstS [Chitinivibrionales bacterium]
MPGTIICCLLIACSVFVSLGSEIILTGSGATFPYPLYKKWIEEYQNQTGTRIDYKPIGSGKGIKQLLDKEVDFGATDAYLTEQELAKIKEPIIHIPTCIGAVVIAYNLPKTPNLQFPPELLADIFLGRVQKWTDKRIVKANPTANLPAIDIAIIHRSESSGTSFIFTSYLCEISEYWEKNIGSGKVVRWPTGMGVEGSPGIVEFIKKIPGSIGYVELSHAQQHNLPTAAIRNKAGAFIVPTMESVSSAAQVNIPLHTRKLLVNTDATHGYPISAFTYLIFYREQAYDSRPGERAMIMQDFFEWMLKKGQQYTSQLYYAPLPGNAVQRANELVQSMTFSGKPLKK